MKGMQQFLWDFCAFRSDVNTEILLENNSYDYFHEHLFFFLYIQEVTKILADYVGLSVQYIDGETSLVGIHIDTKTF